jgi:hypothetical protein
MAAGVVDSVFELRFMLIGHSDPAAAAVIRPPNRSISKALGEA